METPIKQNGEKEDIKKPLLVDEQNGKNGHEDTPDAKGATTTTDAGSRGNVGGVIPTSSLARMSVESEAMRYSITHRRRGHCIIFNHRVFDRVTGLGERNGTDRDRDQVQQQFIGMGFEVKVFNNLTVAEIKTEVQDLAFGTDHADSDMVAVVFMSHGEQDILWGRDAHFKADFLFESFHGDQCKTLAGKPKLFFIQACRGDGLDAGVTLVRSRPSDETDSGYLAYKIPNTADYLICWSTVPGHFSWRNTTNGSWFIQSLVHVLNRDSGHDDLLSMMTSVNRHMIINFESNCPSQPHMHGKKQAASIVSTLMRKVFLTPKY
ncbi:caspase-1-like isoform X2 [Homarus americanus]|uniref:caspase-1-like isoform X2 n=1 Tax=Homarus americanus TaxID=6706 RepID=UPI001C43D5BC|nr:caspase-1-like isoform X2 [Homarus americanus]